MIRFNELIDNPEIVKAIDELGYKEPTPIQQQAIPAILNGQDVLGLSNTGTGKTAAFGIPAICKIKVKAKYPSVLIICPTRELVEQVSTELRKFSKYKEGVKIVPIYGGQPIDRQIQQLKKGCAIVVGTPGRIMDHLRRKTLRLNSCEMVILDEADEMLNMGFKEDIEEILRSMPEDYHPQTILFSATMPDAILKITQQFQEHPIKVKIKSAQRTIDTVKQMYYEVPKGKKVNALRVLLQQYNPKLCMIFCNTKKMVDELCEELHNFHIQAIGLHGDMKQSMRDRVMNQFREGKCSILIATDVAARGIDVDDIELVVNIDVPQDSEYYIHRIGRTGRAGKSGQAITLISGRSQKNMMKDLIRYTKTDIEKCTLPNAKERKKENQKQYIQEVVSFCHNEISKEHIALAKQLLMEDLSMEQLLQGFVAMTYQYEEIDILEEKSNKNKSMLDSIRLKFSLGRRQNIQPGNIVASIMEDCKLKMDEIGKIDVRGTFTLVDIASEKAHHVLEHMKGSLIKGKEVLVELDQEPKNKKSKKQDKQRSKSLGRRKERANKEKDKNTRRMRSKKTGRKESKGKHKGK